MADVVVPIYIYPVPGAWNTLTTSIKANPGLNFQTIVNVDSGPGISKYPPSDYVTAIARLNSFANCHTICYVSTDYTRRPIADVKKDIKTCDGWKKFTSANLKMKGIFFDEAVYDYNAVTSAYMGSITNYSRQLMGNPTITFNPGAVVDGAWYKMADYIIAFEGPVSTYSPSILAAIPPKLRQKSQIILYKFSGTNAAQLRLVKAIARSGVNAIYITTMNVYTTWSTMWQSFCKDVDIAPGLS